VNAPRIRETVQAGAKLFEHEAAGGIVLMATAAVAVAWANLGPDSYTGLWTRVLTIGVAPLVLAKPLLLWINDGLMAIFFFLVGLEIKREILDGELDSTRKAVLPVAAAAGGMLVPAAIYAALNIGGPGVRGWGIPMATDIAFALGVLALLGSRVAPSLRVFLTAVAIADDLGAVAVIAIFYTQDLVWIALGIAVVLLAVLAAVNRLGIQHATPYVLIGAVVWIAVLKSGVHATVAGVLVAFTIPASHGSGRQRGRDAPPLLERLEHGLQGWVAFLIMPVFALANAGVRLTAETGAAALDPIALGIILGLFIGKQIGVGGTCWLLVRFGLAQMPSRAGWRELYGVALLCGIGFTMSLFIATLALSGEHLEPAKIGVLTASFISGVVGYLVLARGAKQGGGKGRRGR
jgi:NhaA family Na+:H+ antiporter